MVEQDGSVITIMESQVQGRKLHLRCRLGWHPWPGHWPDPRVTPDIQHGPEGRNLLGYHWTSHRVCPICGAIQTKAIPLKK